MIGGYSVLSFFTYEGMDFVQTMLKDIEHCSVHTVLKSSSYSVIYEVVYILYTALRSLRTLYYKEVLSRYWFSETDTGKAGAGATGGVGA